MKKILELIEEKTNKLEELYNSAGTNFPLIEDRNRILISLLETEIETLNEIVLELKEEHAEMKEKIRKATLWIPENEKQTTFKKCIAIKDLNEIFNEYKIGGVRV